MKIFSPSGKNIKLSLMARGSCSINIQYILSLLRDIVLEFMTSSHSSEIRKTVQFREVTSQRSISNIYLSELLKWSNLMIIVQIFLVCKLETPPAVSGQPPCWVLSSALVVGPPCRGK